MTGAICPIIVPQAIVGAARGYLAAIIRQAASVSNVSITLLSIKHIVYKLSAHRISFKIGLQKATRRARVMGFVIVLPMCHMRYNMIISKNWLPTCGALTRMGTPCENTHLYRNGRCKNHGGLSTGPRTEEGKARALANLKNLNVSKFPDTIKKGNECVR